MMIWCASRGSGTARTAGERRVASRRSGGERTGRGLYVVISLVTPVWRSLDRRMSPSGNGCVPPRWSSPAASELFINVGVVPMCRSLAINKLRGVASTSRHRRQLARNTAEANNCHCLCEFNAAAAARLRFQGRTRILDEWRRRRRCAVLWLGTMLRDR